MADPWADFRLKPDEAKGDEWAGLRAEKPYSGSILPFSKGEDGKVRFDSNAGLLGSLKSAVTLPGDVYAGRVDPKSDEGIGRAFDMAGWFGPMSAATRAGERSLFGPKPNMVKDRVPFPTTDELYSAADDGFAKARGMGVDYNPAAVGKMAQTVGAKLEQGGFIREGSPETFKIIDALSNPPQGAVAPLDGLLAARSALSKLSVDRAASDRDKAAAVQLLRELETFLQGDVAGSVVAGPAAEASRTVKDAIGNYAAAKRSDKISGIEEMADLRAAANNSGLNGDNQTRQRIISELLARRGGTAGFSPEEIEAFKGVVRGDPVRNTLRGVGNLLGGGGGLGAAVTGGLGAAAGAAATGSPQGAVLGAGLPAIGVIAKMLASKMADKAVSGVDEMVRARSPLYQGRVAAAPSSAATPQLENALIRALMGLDPMPAEREKVR